VKRKHKNENIKENLAKEIVSIMLIL